MKNKTLAIVLAFIIPIAMSFAILTLSASGQSASDGDDTLVLRIANPQATGDCVTVGYEKLAELVDERSDGKMRIDLYPTRCWAVTVQRVNLYRKTLWIWQAAHRQTSPALFQSLWLLTCHTSPIHNIKKTFTMRLIMVSLAIIIAKLHVQRVLRSSCSVNSATETLQRLKSL